MSGAFKKSAFTKNENQNLDNIEPELSSSVQNFEFHKTYDNKTTIIDLPDDSEVSLTDIISGMVIGASAYGYIASLWAKKIQAEGLKFNIIIGIGIILGSLFGVALGWFLGKHFSRVIKNNSYAIEIACKIGVFIGGVIGFCSFVFMIGASHGGGSAGGRGLAMMIAMCVVGGGAIGAFILMGGLIFVLAITEFFKSLVIQK